MPKCSFPAVGLDTYPPRGREIIRLALRKAQIARPLFRDPTVHPGANEVLSIVATTATVSEVKKAGLKPPSPPPTPHPHAPAPKGCLGQARVTKGVLLQKGGTSLPSSRLCVGPPPLTLEVIVTPQASAPGQRGSVKPDTSARADLNLTKSARVGFEMASQRLEPRRGLERGGGSVLPYYFVNPRGRICSPGR